MAQLVPDNTLWACNLIVSYSMLMRDSPRLAESNHAMEP
jgi:hypothetical protein